MDISAVMEKSGAFVVSERRRHDHVFPEAPRLTNPAITISREVGAGAPQVVEGLLKAFRQTDDPGRDDWEVYDRQLIERALQQHLWPKKLAESITEKKRFFLDELMDDLFNLRPPSWVLMPQMIETIRNLAMSGHAILVGHGATIVTAKLPNVFHVRLTASLPTRIERVRTSRGLTHKDAEKLVKAEDRGRQKFLKAHFHIRADKELLYDMAVNTDRVTTTDAVAIISEAARRFFLAL